MCIATAGKDREIILVQKVIITLEREPSLFGENKSMQPRLTIQTKCGASSDYKHDKEQKYL